MESKSQTLDVVIQGPTKPNTIEIIKKWRKSKHVNAIIVSAWQFDAQVARLCDIYIVNEDPGPLPLTFNGSVVRSENINRQILGTIAGIQKANADFCMKWRSDFDFDSLRMDAFISKAIEQTRTRPDIDLFAFTYNTTNPYAPPQLVAHVSDWMYFGRRTVLLEIMPTTTVAKTEDNCSVPERIMKERAFPIGRLSCEQWMLREGLERRYGIRLDRYNDVTQISAYLRLIGKKIILINPQRVGLITEKYDHFTALTRYQWRTFVGSALSTISEFDSLLGTFTVSRPLMYLSLRLKAFSLRIVRHFAKFISRR